MYDTFMLITGIIFIVLTIVTVFLFAVAAMVTKSAVRNYKMVMEGKKELIAVYEYYRDAIQRSNETVVEKFRHDLDCHAGENLK